MLEYLLDTDICIYAIKDRSDALRRKFNEKAEGLCISSVTLSELYYGVFKSTRPDENRKVVTGFAARLPVLPFDEAVAHHAGDIRADLAKRGTPIGPYDVMIAATARSRGLVLVSNNEREFSRVDGLRLENWT